MAEPYTATQYLTAVRAPAQTTDADRARADRRRGRRGTGRRPRPARVRQQLRPRRRRGSRVVRLAGLHRAGRHRRRDRGVLRARHRAGPPGHAAALAAADSLVADRRDRLPERRRRDARCSGSSRTPMLPALWVAAVEVAAHVVRDPRRAGRRYAHGLDPAVPVAARAGADRTAVAPDGAVGDPLLPGRARTRTGPRPGADRSQGHVRADRVAVEGTSPDQGAVHARRADPAAEPPGPARSDDRAETARRTASTPPRGRSTRRTSTRSKAKRRTVPNVDDLMPAGRRIVAEADERGEPLTRDRLAAALRQSRHHRRQRTRRCPADAPQDRDRGCAMSDQAEAHSSMGDLIPLHPAGVARLADQETHYEVVLDDETRRRDAVLVQTPEPVRGRNPIIPADLRGWPNLKATAEHARRPVDAPARLPRRTRTQICAARLLLGERGRVPADRATPALVVGHRAVRATPGRRRRATTPRCG